MSDPTPTPAEIGKFEWDLLREGLTGELMALDGKPGDFAAGWRQGVLSALDRMDSVIKARREVLDV